MKNMNTGTAHGRGLVDLLTKKNWGRPCVREPTPRGMHHTTILQGWVRIGHLNRVPEMGESERLGVAYLGDRRLASGWIYPHRGIGLNICWPHPTGVLGHADMDISCWDHEPLE